MILGIETSCDETGAAVVEDGLHILGNVVASQESVHLKYGGVVPELACRAHIESIIPVISQALETAGVGLRDLSAISVATRPGLIGALLIGLTAAKTLAWVLGVPIVPIDHLQAHIYACNFGENPVDDVGIGIVAHASGDLEVALVIVVFDDVALGLGGLDQILVRIVLVGRH